MAPCKKEKRSRATSRRKHRAAKPSPALAKLEGRFFKHAVVAQSLELMKIALHATMAAVFWIRGLLPHDAFSKRLFPEVQPGQKFSYHDFIEGKSDELELEGIDENGDYITLTTMERGMDDATDQVLDLLEEGIFDALVRRRLREVQFTVMADKDRPDSVVESYTISFECSGKCGNANQLDFDAVVDANLDAKSPEDAEKHIINMTRKLTTLKDPPMLPSHRALGIHLFYTDDCPLKYHAYGFVDSGKYTDDEIILFPERRDWTRTSLLCGRIDSGYHTAALRVSYLKCHEMGQEVLYQGSDSNHQAENYEGEGSASTSYPKEPKKAHSPLVPRPNAVRL